MKNFIAIIKELYGLRRILCEAKRLQNDNCLPLIIQYSIQQHEKRYSFLIGELKQQGCRLCKKLLLLLCVLICVSAAAQTQYVITEAELTELESISENWERNKQSLQLQVRNLKTELSEARKLSENLNAQLRTERETSNALRQSFDAYAKEAAQIQANLEAEKLAHQKTKNQRNALIFILVFIALAAAAFIAVKILIKVYKPF